MNTRETSQDGTVDGPLAGERLETRADAFVAFWFAWKKFFPDGTTYES